MTVTHLDDGLVPMLWPYWNEHATSCLQLCQRNTKQYRVTSFVDVAASFTRANLLDKRLGEFGSCSTNMDSIKRALVWEAIESIDSCTTGRGGGGGEHERVVNCLPTLSSGVL